MNTPTQAQIEAAGKALQKEYAWDVSKHASYWEQLATAALTAAAEVGEQKDLADYRRECEALINRTIERCAQVAEDWGLGRVHQTVKDYPATCAAAIASAIRALKDKP